MFSFLFLSIHGGTWLDKVLVLSDDIMGLEYLDFNEHFSLLT